MELRGIETLPYPYGARKLRKNITYTYGARKLRKNTTYPYGALRFRLRFNTGREI
jgi:hypothetical protein